MSTSTTINQQLMRDVGFSSKPYHDITGNLTIGYGRNLSIVGISNSEAMQMLQNDIELVNNDLITFFPWVQHLDPIRLGVIQNIAFNLGVCGLSTMTKFLGFVCTSQWQEAAEDLMHTKMARHENERVSRLAKQLVSGEWQ